MMIQPQKSAKQTANGYYNHKFKQLKNLSGYQSTGYRLTIKPGSDIALAAIKFLV